MVSGVVRWSSGEVACCVVRERERKYKKRE